MSNKRIQYWDIAKGVSIILVILGHQSHIYWPFRTMIFSFVVPLFFVSNAFFIRSYDIHRTIRRSFVSLLIPYFVISIICAFISASIHSTDRIVVFLHGIRDMLAGLSNASTMFTSFGVVWAIWFIVCLFCSRNIYVASMIFLEKSGWGLSLFFMTILTCIGVIAGVKVAFFPWSLDVALACMIFMWIGDHANKYDLIDRVLNIGTFSIFLLVWVYLFSHGYQIGAAVRNYPGYPLCYISAISGCAVVIYLSKKLEHCRSLKLVASFLGWCGRNSILILAAHNIEMRFVPWDKYLFLNDHIRQKWYMVGGIKIISIILVTFIVSETYKRLKRIS